MDVRGKLWCIKCRSFQEEGGFVSKRGKPSKYCEACLENSRQQEAKRAPRKRDFSEYESRPERRESKKKWAQDNNDKMRSYYKNYRDRKMLENKDDYLARNAANMKKWREANPEKHKAIQERHKASLIYKLTYYKNCAMDKGILWKLTDDDFEIMCNSDCFYCQKSAEDGLNGIDRLDPDGPYDNDNCRGCCEECNMSKGSLTLKQFIAQCARIVSQCEEDENHLENMSFLYEDVPYVAQNGLPYEDCKRSAEKRGITFSLTKEEFVQLVNNPCEYCEQCPESKCCGIDRTDNSDIYVFANCLPCCAMCNYMKRDQNHDDFMNRCKQIVFNFMEKDDDLPEALRPDRARMDGRLTDKPLAKLNGRDKCIIRWSERNKMGDWGDVSGRVETGKGTAADIAKMQKLEEDTKFAMERALQEKIAVAKPQKPKRTYVNRNNSPRAVRNAKQAKWRSKQDDTTRKEKERLAKARYRAKQKAEKITQ